MALVRRIGGSWVGIWRHQAVCRLKLNRTGPDLYNNLATRKHYGYSIWWWWSDSRNRDFHLTPREPTIVLFSESSFSNIFCYNQLSNHLDESKWFYTFETAFQCLIKVIGQVNLGICVKPKIWLKQQVLVACDLDHSKMLNLNAQQPGTGENILVTLNVS